jgi:hypothetical protein
MPTTTDTYPLSWSHRLALLVRIWLTYAAAGLVLRRRGLAAAVERLGMRRAERSYPVALVSRAVSRGLRIGPWEPRCLHRSLVLYTLLREQGEAAELVIGIPAAARTSDAHAWVELGGRDVGPRPGSLGATELTRYPRSPVSESSAGQGRG